jgi:peptide chain release factor subunit 1
LSTKELDNSNLEIIDSVELSEWIVEHYTDYGTELKIVSDKSDIGSQFCLGFGGFGGILRWQFE